MSAAVVTKIKEHPPQR